MSRVIPAMIAVALLVAGSVAAEKDAKNKPAAESKSDAATKDRNVLTLFNGKTLKGWEITNFGGEGEVLVKDGAIHMEYGSEMTGITWKNAKVLPKSNYEISYEGMRVQGGDFFCGLTFPVKKDFCSLILGGWGGGVCGLSSLDGHDASENETTHYKEFEDKKWYKVRLRVLDNRIQAWLNGKEVIDVDTTDTKISIRAECDLSRPLGFATWRTTGAVRKVQVKKLTEKDLKKIADADKATGNK